LGVILRQPEQLDRLPAGRRVSGEADLRAVAAETPWLFLLGHFLLQNLTNILALVHQAGALRLRIQEELQGQDRALLPITEEDAFMAVVQPRLIDLVPVHL
jgi:hypothetical protein